MGRIKTQLVKRTTNDLLNQYGDQFTEDFAQNKVLVGRMVKGVSKKLRNVIAGYATRLTKKNKALQ